MKKIIGLLLLCIVGGFLFLKRDNLPKPSILNDKNIVTTSQKVVPKSIEAKESLFVPYWTVNSTSSLIGYDSAYYFGIEANVSGIDTDEIGYSRIQTFLDKTSDIPNKFLVVRMVDKEINSEVLRDEEAQIKIVNESIAVAKEYGFDGIVLDFEISSISFGAVTDRVTTFYTRASESVRQSDLKFYVTLYGDTYYRVRAYDVKKIGELSDRVLIMAYDFHKARGNPGPNFPMSGKEEYGYDFQQMISDFSNDVPIEKIEIIFGMFGYDWEVDDDKKSLGNGEASSTNEFTGDYIDRCVVEQCEWKRDSQSREIIVTYKSGDADHIIWMEDKESVKYKKDYIQRLGIPYVSYWAYSYY
jgi:spore germination protein YaaH